MVGVPPIQPMNAKDVERILKLGPTGLTPEMNTLLDRLIPWRRLDRLCSGEILGNIFGR